jgi:DNA polymerase III subunit delta
MVAVKAHQAAAFMKAPPTSVTGVLFYGTDPGLVSERSAQLAAMLAKRENPSGEVLRLDDAELDEDAGRLETELKTRPMFSGRRIVRAIAGRRISAHLLKPLIASGPFEGVLIVEAGNLKPDDGIRTSFEATASCYAVACYPDSEADIEALISDILDAQKLRIAPDALALLQSRLGADRAQSRGEIDKLALYCLGRAEVTIEDVESIVGDAANLALDAIASSTAEGRAEAALGTVGRALTSGESGQAVIAILERYFLKLHKVRSDIEAGLSLDDALKGLRPPLFFKQRDAFARQVRMWPRPNLDRALARIADTAKSARLAPALEAARAERLILALSAMATAQSASGAR